MKPLIVLKKVLVFLVPFALGLFLGSFQDHLKDVLSQFRPLYFLDNHDPRIDGVHPDIRSARIIGQKTTWFRVEATDRGSGLNYDQCNMAILFKDGTNFLEVPCSIEKSSSNFNVKPKQLFQYGEYTMRVLLIDRAGNRTSDLLPFFVREEEPIAINVNGCPFERCDPKSKARFTPFLERHVWIKDSCDLYLLDIQIKNNTVKAKLRDIQFFMDTSVALFGVKQMGFGQGIDGVQLFMTPEIFDYAIPEGKLGVSQYLVRIAGIEPEGFGRIIGLLGKNRLMNADWPLPRRVSVNGHYLCDGYGAQEYMQLRQECPIKW